MKVLVTGASGYLGQHVVWTFRARGVEVVETSRCMGEMHDLTFEDRAGAVINSASPSVVVHCAAIVPKTTEDYDDERAADRSLLMLENVALHAECPIVFVSSMTAGKPDTAYARKKHAAQQYLLNRRLRHANDVVVRLPGLFGPPRTWGVIFEAEQAIARGDRPFVPVTDWPVAHVRDAAEHLVAVALSEPHELRVTSGHAVISDLQRARTA